MTTTGNPNEGLTAALDARFEGKTLTLYLTSGLTYTATTIAADAVTASVESAAITPGASTINASGEAELDLSFVINGGVGGVTYDGYAFVLNDGVTSHLVCFVDFEGVSRNIFAAEDRTFYYKPKQSSSVVYAG